MLMWVYRIWSYQLMMLQLLMAQDNCFQQILLEISFSLYVQLLLLSCFCCYSGMKTNQAMQKLKNLQQVLCKYYQRVTWYSQQKQMNLNQNQTIFYEKELSLKQLIDQGCCCNCCYCYCSYLVAAITTTTTVLSIRQSYFLCFSLGVLI